MAPAAVRRATWVAAALAAAIVIIVLAAHGRRPEPGLARFQPAGVMVEIPPDHVSEIVLSRGGQRWRFTRTAGAHWTAQGGPPTLADATQARLEQGLRFLHVSAPQRVMAREELSGTPLAELGLDPPRFSVSVRPRGAEPVTVEFGVRNPQGLAQYAHRSGRDEILLLPSFVGEPWEDITGDH
ncbi:MAG TPA: hypothetical protein VMS64_27240 [Candidatus Methylomirabilis sp.]|nr:hypothetical protein [Candidatus Methylomirabilis sp.]